MTTSNLHPALTAAIGHAAETRPSLYATSTTFRNWVRTLAWTLAAVAVCSAIYPLDKYGDSTFAAIRRGVATLFGASAGEAVAPRLIDYRMFKNPSELPMRIFGLPHFIIALMFVLTSRRLRQPTSIFMFIGLLGVGTCFCWLFYRAGGHLNPFAMFLFYFYFLVHGLRDDAFFYKSYGDMPKDAAATHQRIMAVLQLLILGLLFSLIWPTYVQMSSSSYKLRHPIMENFFPASWPFVLRLGIMFVPMLLISVFAILRMGRRFPGGLPNLWRVHRPILTIFSISLVIILASLIGGPWTFNIVVLMHFVGWYIFALFLMDHRPPARPPRGVWQWMRTTRQGFMTLHLGLAALVTILIAVSIYGFGKDCWLEPIVGSKNFYYWTIMHVTLSFLPR